MLSANATNRILQVGVGGVGAPLAQHLALITKKELVLMDGDVFEDRNRARQPFAIGNTGQNKAIALAQRIYAPQAKVHAIPEFLTQENAEALMEDVRPTMVVAAVDNDDARQCIFSFNDRLPILWGANEIWDPQAGLSTPKWKWNPLEYFPPSEGNNTGCGIQTINANIAAANMAIQLLQIHLAREEEEVRKENKAPVFMARVKTGIWQLTAAELPQDNDTLQ